MRMLALLTGGMLMMGIFFGVFLTLPAPVSEVRMDMVTPEDIFTGTIHAQIQREWDRNYATWRAKEYQRMYEICDEHHNCVPAYETAEAVKEGRPEVTKLEEKTVNPFFAVPVWY